MIAARSQKTVRTVAELAMALGRSERTVLSYMAKGMAAVAKTPSGRYSVAKCRAWAEQHIPPPNGSDRVVPDSELAVALKRAELRKLEEQARKERLKNDILESRLVDREEVELRAGEFGARVRQRLEAFPDEVETQIPLEMRHEVKAELSRAIRSLLLEMSTWEFIGDDKR